jgi:site-specific DNA recombinase
MQDQPMLHFLLRRSKADGGQEHSLDVQRAGCVAFAAARGIKGTPTEHVSDGIAGDDAEGLVALRQLVAAAKPGDVIICRDHSRLGRDMLESATTIRTLVEDRKASLFYYATGEHVQWRNATDAVMSVLRGFGAQSELESIRSRTREAIRTRVKAGKVAGGACYGYDLVKPSPDVATVAIVNAEQADVIRRIFAEYVAGHGYKSIAITLNNERVRAPKAKKRGTGSWSPGQVRDILRRERYIGLYVHGKVNRQKKGGKRVAVKAEASQVMRVEIPEWRIVDDITWRRAQEIAADRAPSQKSENRAVYPLSGLARCEECGGPFGVVNTKVRGGLRVRAYGCVWHHTRGPSVCSVTTRRPVEEVESLATNAIRIALENPDVVTMLMDAVRAEVEAQAVEAASIDTPALEAELIEAKRQHKNLVRVLAKLDDEDEGLTAEIKSLGARVKQLEKSLAVATRAPVEAATLIVQAQEAVRGQLAKLRTAVTNHTAEERRDFYKRALTGVTFRPENEGRPRRFLIEGAVALAGGIKEFVTPPGQPSLYSPKILTKFAA